MTDLKQIKFYVTPEAFAIMAVCARRKSYHKIGEFARFTLEQYIRRYAENEEEREIGLHLEEIGK